MMQSAGAFSLTHRGKTVVLGIVLGLLCGQAGAYEPPTADGAMVYLRIPFDAVRGSDQVASIGLRLGEALVSEDAPSRVFQAQGPNGPANLDLHFYRSERGGPQLNGIGLTRRHDLSRFGIPLFVGTD